MIDFLYNYYLKRPKSKVRGFLSKRLFWYLYKFLKIALKHYFEKHNAQNTNKINILNDVIVSLTSVPSRISSIHLTINSICNQSLLPHKIILWLGEDKFPNKLKDLPISLLMLQKKGLEIKFCKDLGPHTKYYYTFLNYKNFKIVTIDDDLFYPRDMIKILVTKANKFSNSVIANRVREISWNDRSLNPYRSWQINTYPSSEPTLKLFATGVGGVLYNPSWFSDDLYDIETIFKYCKNADDIWLKANQIKNKIPVVFTNYYINPFIEIPNSQHESLHKSNVFSGENDNIMKATFSHFNINYNNDLI